MTNIVGGPEAMSAESPLRLKVFVSPTHTIASTDQTFSPTTSSIVYGENEAMLVDAQYIRQDIDNLAEMIDRLGKKLTTIFITHGHADHYFGIDSLAQRFPGVRVVATPKVAADISANGAEQISTFSAWFGDDIVIPNSVPDIATDSDMVIDGHRVFAVDVDQADIAPSSVLHVPQLGAVIAGDLAYNEIHQMLALTGPAQWSRWAASVDAVAALQPRIVVAGHKKPDASDHDGQAILAGTKRYINDFAAVVQQANGSTSAVIEQMRARYPDHGNLTTLLVSAKSAVQATTALAAVNEFATGEH